MALSTSEKLESISKVGQSLFLSLIFRKMLLHVDRQWHSPEPKHTDQELYKLIWETFWDFLGIRTNVPPPFHFSLNTEAPVSTDEIPHIPAGWGTNHYRSKARSNREIGEGCWCLWLGQPLGTSRSLSPTRDVVEMSLGVARNIINNMVMKKG